MVKFSSTITFSCFFSMLDTSSTSLRGPRSETLSHSGDLEEAVGKETWWGGSLQNLTINSLQTKNWG